MVGDGENDIQAGKNAGCKESVFITEENSLLDFAKKLETAEQK